MRKIIKWNVGILLLFIIFPIVVASYVNYADITWAYRGLIRSIINYSAVAVGFIAGIGLIGLNIKTLKHNSSIGKSVPILFIFVGSVAIIYNFFMFMIVYAFRNGINF